MFDFKTWACIIVLGVVSWAVPFFGSFTFFTQTGELTVPLPLFKSIMVVFGTLVAIFLLTRLFRRVPLSQASALLVGVIWLAINWGLDLWILLPMSGMSTTDYFYDIGLRYLAVPVIAWGMGYSRQRGI